MAQMIRFFIVLLALLSSWSAVAEDQSLANLFSQQGIEGTIVISALQSEKIFIHNDFRAHQRVSTASTC
jgi:beta-lactamase class D